MKKIALPSDQNATGRTFGESELRLLQEVIESGTLNCTKGTQVKAFESEFAARYGVTHCRAITSGTAACHCAIAALDLEPGDEVISTPITDMGAIIPILYQQLVPVFADVDPVTLNMTAETIEKVITSKTRAIVVTHLFGNPCEMREIMALADQHGIPVIEDCAQSYLATYDGRLTGTIGAVGCFSLQQGKHMTTGEGGIVITNDDAHARRMRLFSDKAWGYGDPKPDHYFLGMNYRMTELQGAVARAQLQKLDDCVKKRQETAYQLHRLLEDIPGLTLPIPSKNATHSYWKYPLIVDADVIKGGATALGKELIKRDLFCAPRYIQKPAFECQVLKEQVTFGKSRLPYSLNDKKPHEQEYPGTYQGLSQVLVLPWNEKYDQEHIDFIAETIHEGIKCLTQ